MRHDWQKLKHSYHSALNRPEICAELKRQEWRNGSVAFQHDLMEGLTADYAQCDILYADPPWDSGYEVFNRRAGFSGERTFYQLYAGITNIINYARQPVIIVTGRRAGALLPKPTQQFEILLNGGLAACLCFRIKLDRAYTTSVDLLYELADVYECVGDFCCGYGRAARIFHSAGKLFVCSDFNAQCIGHLAGMIDGA